MGGRKSWALALALVWACGACAHTSVGTTNPRTLDGSVTRPTWVPFRTGQPRGRGSVVLTSGDLLGFDGPRRILRHGEHVEAAPTRLDADILGITEVEGGILIMTRGGTVYRASSPLGPATRLGTFDGDLSVEAGGFGRMVVVTVVDEPSPGHVPSPSDEPSADATDDASVEPRPEDLRWWSTADGRFEPIAVPDVALDRFVFVDAEHACGIDVEGRAWVSDDAGAHVRRLETFEDVRSLDVTEGACVFERVTSSTSWRGGDAISTVAHRAPVGLRCLPTGFDSRAEILLCIDDEHGTGYVAAGGQHVTPIEALANVHIAPAWFRPHRYPRAFVARQGDAMLLRGSCDGGDTVAFGEVCFISSIARGEAATFTIDPAIAGGILALRDGWVFALSPPEPVAVRLRDGETIPLPLPEGGSWSLNAQSSAAEISQVGLGGEAATQAIVGPSPETMLLRTLPEGSVRHSFAVTGLGVSLLADGSSRVSFDFGDTYEPIACASPEVPSPEVLARATVTCDAHACQLEAGRETYVLALPDVARPEPAPVDASYRPFIDGPWFAPDEVACERTDEDVHDAGLDAIGDEESADVAGGYLRTGDYVVAVVRDHGPTSAEAILTWDNVGARRPRTSSRAFPTGRFPRGPGERLPGAPTRVFHVEDELLVVELCQRENGTQCSLAVVRASAAPVVVSLPAIADFATVGSAHVFRHASHGLVVVYGRHEAGDDELRWEVGAFALDVATATTRVLMPPVIQRLAGYGWLDGPEPAVLVRPHNGRWYAYSLTTHALRALPVVDGPATSECRAQSGARAHLIDDWTMFSIAEMSTDPANFELIVGITDDGYCLDRAEVRGQSFMGIGASYGAAIGFDGDDRASGTVHTYRGRDDVSCTVDTGEVP